MFPEVHFLSPTVTFECDADADADDTWILADTNSITMMSTTVNIWRGEAGDEDEEDDANGNLLGSSILSEDFSCGALPLA